MQIDKSPDEHQGEDRVQRSATELPELLPGGTRTRDLYLLKGNRCFRGSSGELKGEHDGGDRLVIFHVMTESLGLAGS
jgi:hypothetical protein